MKMSLCRTLFFSTLIGLSAAGSLNAMKSEAKDSKALAVCFSQSSSAAISALPSTIDTVSHGLPTPLRGMALDLDPDTDVVEMKEAKKAAKSLSLDEISMLLEQYKKDYAKGPAVHSTERRNKGAVCRAILTSKLLKLMLVVVIICYFWADIGNAIPLVLICGQSNTTVNSTALNETIAASNNTLSSQPCHMGKHQLLGSMYDSAPTVLSIPLLSTLIPLFFMLYNEITSITPTPAITLKRDVIGLDDSTIKTLSMYIDMFNNPKKYQRLNAKIPKGLLLVGPAGTGKTLIAKAIAGSTHKNFFDRSASEFEHESEIEELFGLARKHSPAIIFIDEIDAIAAINRNQQSTDAGFNRTKGILLRLLIELANPKNEAIFIIAATNYPRILEAALTRSGRFDDVIEIPKPDFNGKVKLLLHYIFKQKDIDVSTITAAFIADLAARIDGLTGADIENIINKAALLAANQESQTINATHIGEALNQLITSQRALKKSYC